jgi:hypothetical protein
MRAAPHLRGIAAGGKKMWKFPAAVETAAGRATSSCPRQSGRERKEQTMQYMLLIHVDEAAMAAMAPDATPGQAYAMAQPFAAYNEALKKAGAWVAGDRLAPSSSTTRVRMLGDRTEVLDGPFADTKEQLGGYYIIEAPDLDAAIQWAARCPAAQNRAVEVRPIWKAQ